MMSFVHPEGAAPLTGAARVGSDFCHARERLGWALADVAASLNIRAAYLEAIEQGRLGSLPGHTYAMGFIRTYATALGLDPDEMSRRFRAETQGASRKVELTFPAPVPQRGVPAGAVVLLGLLIGGIAYVGWYRYSDGGEPRAAQVSSPPPDRLVALAAPMHSPQVASILPSPVQATNLPISAAASPPLPAPSLPAPSLPVPTPVPVPIPIAIAPPAPVPPPAAITTRLMLRAKTGGWVQVREKQGQVLLNRVMRPGETWPVPMKPQLLLTTSNAGAMELLVDGVAAPALGPAGALRRDVPLDPNLVKAGKTASSPTPSQPQ